MSNPTNQLQDNDLSIDDFLVANGLATDPKTFNTSKQSLIALIGRREEVAEISGRIDEIERAEKILQAPTIDPPASASDKTVMLAWFKDRKHIAELQKDRKDQEKK